MEFVKIRKIGCSIVSTIPDKIVKELDIKSGEHLQIEIVDKKIVSKIMRSKI